MPNCTQLMTPSITILDVLSAVITIRQLSSDVVSFHFLSLLVIGLDCVSPTIISCSRCHQLCAVGQSSACFGRRRLYVSAVGIDCPVAFHFLKVSASFRSTGIDGCAILGRLKPSIMDHHVWTLGGAATLPAATHLLGPNICLRSTASSQGNRRDYV